MNVIREYNETDRQQALNLIVQFFNHHADCVSSERWIDICQAESILDEWLESKLLFLCEVTGSDGPASPGAILGLARLREDHGTYWVEDIIVDARYRGQGIGTGILKWAEDWVRARGASSLFLDVVPANLAALDFFIGRGYVYLNTIELRKDLAEPATPEDKASLDKASLTPVTLFGRRLLVRGLPDDR